MGFKKQNIRIKNINNRFFIEHYEGVLNTLCEHLNFDEDEDWRQFTIEEVKSYLNYDQREDLELGIMDYPFHNEKEALRFVNNSLLVEPKYIYIKDLGL